MVPTTDGLGRLLDQLEKLALPADEVWLSQVAQELAKLFHVQADEVAVLELSQDTEALKFVLPEKLRMVGEIPLTSYMALAARTVRDRRAEIVNAFSSARHASVFEGVPLGRMPEESIHKIMSAPIVVGKHVIGVVQISHKGLSPVQCGSDFTYDDLAKLKDINKLLARFLALVTGSAAGVLNQVPEQEPVMEMA